MEALKLCHGLQEHIKSMLRYCLHQCVEAVSHQFVDAAKGWLHDTRSIEGAGKLQRLQDLQMAAWMSSKSSCTAALGCMQTRCTLLWLQVTLCIHNAHLYTCLSVQRGCDRGRHLSLLSLISICRAGHKLCHCSLVIMMPL